MSDPIFPDPIYPGPIFMNQAGRIVRIIEVSYVSSVLEDQRTGERYVARTVRDVVKQDISEMELIAAMAED